MRTNHGTGIKHLVKLSGRDKLADHCETGARTRSLLPYYVSVHDRRGKLA